MQEFCVRILVDPKHFPLGIPSLVAAVIRQIQVATESASGSSSRLYLVVVDARLSGNKRGKSVATKPFLSALPLG